MKHLLTKSKRITSKNIVKSIIHDASADPPGETLSPTQLIAALTKGLPFQEIEELRQALDLTMEKLVPLLGISPATLHRRKAMGKLDVSESDRVLRFARLVGKSLLVMESLEIARQWLSSPQRGLGGAIPLEYAATEYGAREVELLLARIEHGIYS